VLMQQLLLVTINNILPFSVRDAITRLCLFFNSICKKVIDPQMSHELKNEAIIVLCQLEMYFSSSPFDRIMHLIVHCCRRYDCLAQFIWDGCTLLRDTWRLKGYVKNQYQLKALIIERHIAEEAIEFSLGYMPNCEMIGILKAWHDGRCEFKGTQNVKIKIVSRKDVDQAHLYILNNTDKVTLAFRNTLMKSRQYTLRMNEKWALNKHNKTFLAWFKRKVYDEPNISDTLLRLVMGQITWWV